MRIMIRRSSLLIAIFTITAIDYAFSQEGRLGSETNTIVLNYPNPRRDENVSDIYHNNTIVKDPYRWMENLNSDETKKLIEAENALTRSYLDKSPFRAEFEARLKELYNQRYSKFFQKGKRFFSYQNTGLQNQESGVVFVHDSLTSEGRVLLDPNTLSQDGTIAFDPYFSAFSEDGQIFAYILIANGSDWRTVLFKHVEQGDIYKEKLENVKFSTLAWTHDNKGVFYSAYLDQKNKTEGLNINKDGNHRLYYHVVGTDQSQDVVVAEFPEHPDYWLFGNKVSKCGKYLIVCAHLGNENMIHIADLEKINYQIKGKLQLIPIVPKLEASYRYVNNHNRTFIFNTNKDAGNSKLIKIDIDNPDPKTWTDLVPENKTDVLEWAAPVFNKYMVLSYTQNVKTVLQLHDIKTGNLVKKFDLEIGVVDYYSFFSEEQSQTIYFRFESFLTPGIIYRCNLSAPSSFTLEVFKENKLKNFDRTKYTTEQVFYKSKDGTTVPMYLTYKKGLQKNGNNPTFLHAYGGYGSSSLPNFRIDSIAFMSNFDGIFAVANIRSGG